ncbi:MAG TPA: efflux RND transporter periplasmic adaptor subunit [Cytophagaceae bacterium]
MKTKVIALLLIAVVILIVVFFKPWKVQGPEAAPNKPASVKSAAVAVNAVIVKPERLKNNIYSTGTILANEEVELKSEIAGRITGIYFNEGGSVTKGQLLVKINDADFKAQLSKIRLQEKLAIQEEERKRQLLEIKGISQEEYDRALNLVNTLRADAALLEAQIAKTEIRAPFSGVVGLRHVSEGGFISQTTLIATMQELNPVKVEFSIPEKYAYIVKKGSTITFTTANNDRKYTGKVYATSTQIDPNTRSLTLRATANNADLSLTPGAFVKIEFTLDEINNALLVPSEAVVPILGGQKVYVVKNGKAVPAKVETGIRTEKEVQITSGLSPADTVVITGLLQIRDNVDVQVKEIVDKDSLKISSQTN